MIAAPKRIFYPTFIFLFLTASAALAAKLSLPVELSIENGGYENCMVSITKNGLQQEPFPGKSTLNIHLEFNNDYILSFTKPGYITKKIAVNTAVTPEREKQLFDPYKIGVKLFKQYEGINIVVYNQPVAKIKFNPAIDDFDYDVDYTKSILSKLQNTEQELEIRASEERRLIATGELPSEGFEIKASSSERFAVFPKISGAKGISPENKSEENSTFRIFPSKDSNNNGALDGGADPKNPSELNNGDQPPASTLFNNGNDSKNNLSGSEGTNKTATVLNAHDGKDNNNGMAGLDHLDTKSGSEKSIVIPTTESKNVSSNSGVDDVRNSAIAIPSRISKTKEFTVEPNRTITTIKVNYGANATVYRKVLYNWGGLFYFKDLSYSISQELFRTGTGEK